VFEEGVGRGGGRVILKVGDGRVYGVEVWYGRTEGSVDDVGRVGMMAEEEEEERARRRARIGLRRGEMRKVIELREGGRCDEGERLVLLFLIIFEQFREVRCRGSQGLANSLCIPNFQGQ